MTARRRTSIAIGILAVLAIGAGVLYNRGYVRGGQRGQLAGLEGRQRLGGVNVSVDSAIAERKKRVAALSHAQNAALIDRAQAARARIEIAGTSSISVDQGPVQNIAPAAVSLIRLQDTTILGLQAEIANLWSFAAADSLEKMGLRAQRARSDSMGAIYRAMKIPRCSAKCGAAIGAGTVITVLGGLAVLLR